MSGRRHEIFCRRLSLFLAKSFVFIPVHAKCITFPNSDLLDAYLDTWKTPVEVKYDGILTKNHHYKIHKRFIAFAPTGSNL